MRRRNIFRHSSAGHTDDGCRCCGPDRAPDAACVRARRRRAVAPGRRRRTRRTVLDGRRRCGRLYRRTQQRRSPVYPESVRVWRPGPLPHRRCGQDPRRWDHPAPRASRPAGKGPWLPRRARTDRGRTQRRPRCVRRGGCGGVTNRGRRPSGRVRRAERRPGTESGCPAGHIAGSFLRI